MTTPFNWLRGADRDGRVVPDSGRAWYILGLLTLAYGLSYVDRQLLNLLVEPVKRSFQITDVQISILQGAAFVIPYCLMGPAIGRLVDVSSRRNVLMACIAIWSVSTAACGLASSFAELVSARAIVGMSEACLFPVAWSLIPEMFSASRGARAYSVFAMGSNLGSAFSLLFGGAVVAGAARLSSTIPQLGQFAPWQLAFIVVGLPGLLFCGVLFLLREPQRSQNAGEGPVRYSFSQSVAVLTQNWRFYLPIIVSNGTLAIVALSIPAWVPSFLARAYHVAIVDIGFYFGIVLLVSSTVGLYFGPLIAQRLSKNGAPDASLTVATVACGAMAAFSLALPFAPTAPAALVIVGLLVASTMVCSPLLGFSCQRIAPAPVRGFVSSLWTLSAQVIGYGTGPTLVALMTEHVFRNPTMVGWSLQVVCAAAATATGLLVFVARPAFRNSLVKNGAH
jgi:MFS family permease